MIAWWFPSPLLMVLSAPFVLSGVCFLLILWACEDGRPADLEPEDLYEPLAAAPFDWEWHEDDFFWERAA